MRSSDRPTTHIIGAGLAGLAAAVRLTQAGHKVAVHEAALQAGGRCRTYFDGATGLMIDNGTHVVLSGNRCALALAATIGSLDALQRPEEAEFRFVDLASGERWALKFNDSRFPWWLFDRSRRAPQTGVVDYLPLARLAFGAGDRAIGDVVDCSGPMYRRFLEPLLLAALNTAPREGSSKLAAALIRETVALGGAHCRPLLAPAGIGKVFIEPAIAYLRDRGVDVRLGDELTGLVHSGPRVGALKLSRGVRMLGPADRVVLAVPPYAAARLVPGLRVPTAFRGILNVHFAVVPGTALPPMLGVLNGISEWIFSGPDRVSVTISNANRHFKTPRIDLAHAVWREVAQLAGFPHTMPRWQVVRERRATFAATPAQNGLRPPAQTSFENVLLAGDWTATGLPATLEGAVRSGFRAADLIAGAERAAA
jgi:squalene-associated FAD-dependent desaturase